jgi:hypothetical protein
LAPTVGSLGVEIMNSTSFSLPSNINSKIGGKQITFGTMDFQPHPATIGPIFASLDQEMDLAIEILNFHVGSLGSTRLLDPINSGPSAGKTASAAISESSVGSSSEVNSPVIFKPTENIKDTVEGLDEIMENLNLGKSSDKFSDENFDSDHQPAGDFMICCDNTLDKSTDTWKTGLELYEDNQAIFSSSSSKINHRYQVFTIIEDKSEEFDDNNNPILNPANVTRGANHLAKGDTTDSLTTRAKVRLTEDEWKTIKAVVDNGAAIPIDARKEVLLGYHYALHRQSKQLEREKK